MAGMNGQEGGLFYDFELKAFAAQINKSIAEGVDKELVEGFLLFKCSQLTPFSPKLCLNFIMKTYKIDEAEDDKQRAARLTDFMGKFILYIITHIL